MRVKGHNSSCLCGSSRFGGTGKREREHPKKWSSSGPVSQLTGPNWEDGVACPGHNDYSMYIRAWTVFGGEHFSSLRLSVKAQTFVHTFWWPQRWKNSSTKISHLIHELMLRILKSCILFLLVNFSALYHLFDSLPMHVQMKIRLAVFLIEIYFHLLPNQPISSLPATWSWKRTSHRFTKLTSELITLSISMMLFSSLSSFIPHPYLCMIMFRTQKIEQQR